MKKHYKVRLLIYLYGAEIIKALTLDDLLKTLQKTQFTSFEFDRIPDEADKNIQKDLYFLEEEGFVKSYLGGSYEISKKGDLKLSTGGFVADAKKSKNSLFAFRISIVAITLSIISFLVSLLSD